MNIFALSINPEEAARWYVDSHVRKMHIEAAQMLSAAHHALDPRGASGRPWLCLPAYVNNPVTLWARSNTTRYLWLASLGMWLCHEYRHRYGKVHATQARLEKLIVTLPAGLPPGGDLLPFTLAMPEHFHQADTVAAYCDFYQHGKAHLHRWTRRDPPAWINSL